MTPLWLFPLAWALYTALRPYRRHASHRLPFDGDERSTLDNFVDACNQANFPQFFLNTLIVTVPAVIVTLFGSSLLGFAVSRFSWRFNLLLLMIFTAGNLLPPQVIIVPLYRLYLVLPLPQPLSDNGTDVRHSTSGSSSSTSCSRSASACSC